MTKLEKDYALVVAENLRRLIYEKQVEQKDIAKVTGVSPASVSLWLSGQRTPRMKHIDALCKFLGCTRADIMEPSWKKREQKEISDEQADLRLFIFLPHKKDPRRSVSLWGLIISLRFSWKSTR